MRPVTQSPLCEAALAASLRFWVTRCTRSLGAERPVLEVLYVLYVLSRRACPELYGGKWTKEGIVKGLPKGA